MERRLSVIKNLLVAILSVAIASFLVLYVLGAQTELSYEKMLAPKYKARTEVRLPDGARCDLVNENYAIEIDWAHKWAESIGQSLYYAEILKKKPGIILLISSPKDKVFIKRCQTVCRLYAITLYLENISKIKGIESVTRQ